MRLQSISVANTPPVERFAASDLADVVVIAGPNGGGGSVLDLSSADDMNLFRNTLQQNRRRQAWRSSLVNIESDRTIHPWTSSAKGWGSCHGTSIPGEDNARASQPAS